MCLLNGFFGFKMKNKLFYGKKLISMIPLIILFIEFVKNHRWNYLKNQEKIAVSLVRADIRAIVVCFCLKFEFAQRLTFVITQPFTMKAGRKVR